MQSKRTSATHFSYTATLTSYRPKSTCQLVGRGPAPGLHAHLGAAMWGKKGQAEGPGCFSPSVSPSLGDRWFFFIVKLWTFKTC